MEHTIAGSPGFAYLEVDLDPGESLVSEAGAMSSMAADLDIRTVFNGGFFSGLAKRFLGGESMFVNHFTNSTREPRRVTLAAQVPGDIRLLDLRNETFYFQPGSFLACTPGIKIGVGYAGIGSFVAREGLFRLKISGTGRVFYSAFGGILEKRISGSYIVDSGHLVGYDAGIQLRMKLAGGMFSSFFGGEGLVSRLEGNGRVLLQTRSLSGLVTWLNPKLR